MNLILDIFIHAWDLLLDASLYILFGIAVAGILRVFMNPGAVVRHLGRGRISSVFKAALMGIPIPLCSCGVLPAAASLKRQGANNGATAAFLISTPESGVDSISLTYALLDPIMTVARPVAAFVTAAAAGLAENAVAWEKTDKEIAPDLTCPVDGCCDGIGCPPAEHRRHHGFSEKAGAGLRYAFGDLWDDIAVWFLAGVAVAGAVTVLVPSEMMTRYLGGGFSAMLIMLALGIPMYICASASTPIAAAFILTGVSPGAAMVFLLAGPATNITSLTVLLGILGKRATAIYLSVLALSSVTFGLFLDWTYACLGVSARAVAGQATEIIPEPLQLAGAVVLLLLSVKPLYLTVRGRLSRSPAERTGCKANACGCSSDQGQESKG